MPDSNGPLEGIRVIDASNLIAAPMASTFLADFGAEVIKLEIPEHGDVIRVHGKSKDGQPLWWKFIGRNKKSITLYLGTKEGQDLFRQLAADADVVIENYRPGTMARWGLSYETLSANNPGLVMAHVTGFGQTGPLAHRAGFGTLGEALSGFVYRNGQPDGPPTLPPLGLADNVTGFITAFAIMTALWARQKTGKGQEIDAAIVDSLLPVLEPQLAEFDQLGTAIERLGSRSPVNAPRNLYRTKDDRWVAVSASTEATAGRLLTLAGRPDLLGEPWFKTASGRVGHIEELDEAVAAWVATLSMDDVIAACDDVGAPVSAVYSAADIAADEHYRARGSIVDVPDPVLGTVLMPGLQFRLSDTPGSIRWAGPEMGEHNEEVYGKLGLTAEDLAALREKGVI